FREFKTVTENQERIVIPVYQGFEEVASRNELQGEIVIPADGPIPEDKRVPKGTPFDVGFSVDEYGTLTIEVRGREALSWLKSGKVLRTWEYQVEERKSAERDFIKYGASLPMGKGQGGDGVRHGSHENSRGIEMVAKQASNEPHLSSAGKRLLVTCLLNTGQGSEAERFITSQVAQSDGDRLRFHLALAYAQQGKTDEAVLTFLEILDKDPEDQSARQAALTLLHKQAVQKINARDWAGAGSALGDALKIDPDNSEIKQLLAGLDDMLPVAYLKANKRQEAAEVWEKAQRRNAENGKMAHSLSLLYGYWATSLEQKGEGAQVEPLWQRAIGNWVLTRYSDSFWQEWTAQRQSVYQMPDGAISKLRASWGEELSKRFRRYVSEYEAAGKTTDAERHRRLEIIYWLEHTTASALYELKKVKCSHCLQMTAAVPGSAGDLICEHSGCGHSLMQYRPPHPIPVCGPGMLKHFGVEKEAQKLVSQTSQLPNSNNLSGDLTKLSLPFVKNNAEALSFCLSPWNQAFALVANRRFEEAIALLGAAKTKGSPDRERGILMLYACLERGKQQMAAISQLPAEPDKKALDNYLVPARRALKTWGKGLEHQAADSELSDRIGERIEKLSTRIANELIQASRRFNPSERQSDIIRLLTAAIEVLKLVMKIMRRERIVATLTMLYAERGTCHLKEDASEADFELAIADYEEAIKLSPESASIKQQAAVIYNSRGCKGTGEREIRAFTRAIELDGSNALYYRNRGVTQSDPDAAISDLTLAYQMEPKPDYAQDLAIAYNSKGLAILKPYEHSYYTRPSVFELRNAQNAFGSAMRLDPSNPTYRENYNTVTQALAM
ncbi:MAG: hypothetical protein L0229_16325, partial [Blastocatellia bacterium]|nr:hypothetical protein [Blastocatellia bacterium]